MLRLSLALLMLAPFAAPAADDPRVSFLEQEVRNLQRQVQVLTRQMDELRTRPDRPAARSSTSGVAPRGGEFDPVGRRVAMATDSSRHERARSHRHPGSAHLDAR